MDTEAEAKILAAVDDLFEAQVRLTQDLVRFPSLRGQEHTIQDFVYEVLRSRGAVMDRWRIAEDDMTTSSIIRAFRRSIQAMKMPGTWSAVSGLGAKAGVRSS